MFLSVICSLVIFFQPNFPCNSDYIDLALGYMCTYILIDIHRLAYRLVGGVCVCVRVRVCVCAYDYMQGNKIKRSKSKETDSTQEGRCLFFSPYVINTYYSVWNKQYF